jgi:hypothetical protein
MLAGSHTARRHDEEQELQEICALLEKAVVSRDGGPDGRGEALENLLSELDEGDLVGRSNAVIQEGVVVGDILRHAWALDQEAILKAQQEALDEALSSLDSSITPLEKLQISIADLARCVQNVEYLLDALAEELGTIDLEHLENDAKDVTVEKHNADMESQLKQVLNDLKDIRPTKAPPLLMLNRDDILTEIRSLQGRLGVVESSERAWADELVQEYSRRPVHPTLLKVYANSPLNTSPPFSLPFQAQGLESQFKRKASDLHGATSSLETETRETFAKAGKSKRFEAFVDHWCGSQRA